jgi:hypothetical protein
MVDTTKCVTVSVTTPTPTVTVTINDVYVTRDGYRTDTIYKGEYTDRYAICYNVTVSGVTQASVNVTIKAGKDQNSLKTVAGYSQTISSGTYTISMYQLANLYIKTDDFLNAVGATDSCVICVTISYG